MGGGDGVAFVGVLSAEVLPGKKKAGPWCLSGGVQSATDGLLLFLLFNTQLLFHTRTQHRNASAERNKTSHFVSLCCLSAAAAAPHGSPEAAVLKKNTVLSSSFCVNACVCLTLKQPRRGKHTRAECRD